MPGDVGREEDDNDENKIDDEDDNDDDDDDEHDYDDDDDEEEGGCRGGFEGRIDPPRPPPPPLLALVRSTEFMSPRCNISTRCIERRSSDARLGSPPTSALVVVLDEDDVDEVVRFNIASGFDSCCTESWS
jgi:hypothetical protein